MDRPRQTGKMGVDKHPVIPHSERSDKSFSLEAAMVLEKNPIKRFFKVLGPGLITGASNGDPSTGIRSQVGIKRGYKALGSKRLVSRCPTIAVFQVTGPHLANPQSCVL